MCVKIYDGSVRCQSSAKFFAPLPFPAFFQFEFFVYCHLRMLIKHLLCSNFMLTVAHSTGHQWLRSLILLQQAPRMQVCVNSPHCKGG